MRLVGLCVFYARTFPPRPHVLRMHVSRRATWPWAFWDFISETISSRPCTFHATHPFATAPQLFNAAMIKQFLQDVVWGELDYLIIDTPPGMVCCPVLSSDASTSEARTRSCMLMAAVCAESELVLLVYLGLGFALLSAPRCLQHPSPKCMAQSTHATGFDFPLLAFSLSCAGTSDEHISVVEHLRAYKPDGAVVVTTPQGVAVADVRKELNFCKRAKLRVLGVVENMSGYVCPCCGVRVCVRAVVSSA